MNRSRRYPPAWVLVSAAWIGPAILAAFEAFFETRLEGRGAESWRVMLWQGGDWLIYAFLTPLVFALARRYRLRGPALGARVLLHLASGILLCAAWAGLGSLLRWAVIGPSAAPTSSSLLGWFLISLPFGVAVYFAVLGIEHAVFYFVAARERETDAARLEAQLADARLDALRMQMQPHFLFNSLNAIAVTVRDHDNATATRLLEQLGEMLHRVMRADRPPEVPLADELDFVRRYLAIEEVRFPDRLRPVYDIPAGLEQALVPDFILQPLVENALRHGLARRVNATKLLISARKDGEDLVLQVTDDGPGPDQPAERREGVGLANARERLATLYGTRGSLTLQATAEGGAVATVRLPFRNVDGPGA